MANEITVDERGRTSLARVRTKQFTRYSVEEHDNGTLVLRPAVTVPIGELPQSFVTERIDEFLDHPETGTRRTRPAR